MIYETWLGHCPKCDQYYRGLLYICPHCGAELRPKPKETEAVWELVKKQVKDSGK